MLLKEKNFEIEKKDYLDEGWIEGEISLLARDKEKAYELFDELVENFENKKRIPLKITFIEIERAPFVGVIVVKFLSYDISIFAKTLLYHAPVYFEFYKDEINLRIYTLNEIFLDICDTFKVYKYETKANVYVKGGYVEGKDIEGIIILEFSEKSKEKVFEEMEKANKEISKFSKIIEIKKDDILEEEIEEENKKEKIYIGNMEIHLKTNFFTFVDLITQFTPTSIEILSPTSIKFNRDEIYLFLGKILFISQRYTEKMRKIIKI